MDVMELAGLPHNLTDALDLMPILADNVTVTGMKPEAWKTWGVGLAIVTACSFAPSIAILFLSFISKTVFNRILTFLIALGVGALSGSALFILLPTAFHVSEMPSQDYVYKSWMTLGGIYMLFVIDKLIKFFFEIRKMQKARRKIQSEVTIEQIVTDVFESIEKKDHPLSIQAFSSTPLPLYPEVVVVPKPKIAEVKKMSEDDEESAEIRSVAFMILLGSWINNFVDGMSMGAAFANNFIRGLSLGIAVLSQQFPQELASLAIIISSGLGLKKALLLNLIQAVLSYMGFIVGKALLLNLIQAVLSYMGFIVGVLLNNVGERYDDIIFAISAGMYLYICLSILIPEMSAKVLDSMQENRKESLLASVLQLFGIALGLVFMFLMALYGGDIQF
uniref:Solute carrier family 39 member 1 n=1 Tax=Plectus sambesii TaxID=2011161 RepID=A0A914X2W6_9BILA